MHGVHCEKLKGTFLKTKNSFFKLRLSFLGHKHEKVYIQDIN